MTIRLRVSKVEQVVCNNYTLQVEPGELAKALSEKVFAVMNDCVLLHVKNLTGHWLLLNRR